MTVAGKAFHAAHFISQFHYNSNCTLHDFLTSIFVNVVVIVCMFVSRCYYHVIMMHVVDRARVIVPSRRGHLSTGTRAVPASTCYARRLEWTGRNVCASSMLVRRQIYTLLCH